MREASSRPVSADWQLQMIGEAWWRVFKGPVWRVVCHLLVRMYTAGINALMHNFLTSQLCYVSCVTVVEMMMKWLRGATSWRPAGTRLSATIWIMYISILPHALITVLQSVSTTSVCLILNEETRFSAKIHQIWRQRVMWKLPDISMTCFHDCELITNFKSTSPEDTAYNDEL